jgi:molybdopterin-guanine dinucleotide biosynthesis protein A
MTASLSVAGLVLCGGRSSRMGLPKLALPFGPELMLPRVVRLLSEIVEPVIVVAAPDQEIPPLPGRAELIRDAGGGRGPMEGLAAGLRAHSGRADAAYVTGCDVPLLVPDFVRRMIDMLGDVEIAVPEIDGFPHPLAAVYRTRIVPQVEQLLAAGRLRPVFLFDSVSTRRVTAEELRDIDPELRTLQNLNRPEDYLAALAAAGLSAPPEVLAQWQPSRANE